MNNAGSCRLFFPADFLSCRATSPFCRISTVNGRSGIAQGLPKNMVGLGCKVQHSETFFTGLPPVLLPKQDHFYAINS
jgi:hypothetical protein